MNYKSSIRRIFKRLTAFVGLPLIFVFLSYLVIYFAASPLIAPFSSAISMFIGDSVPEFSTDTVIDSDVEFVEIGANQEEVISVNDIKLPKIGEKYAHITIPNTGVDCDVYYGDSNAVLRKGPGQYDGSKLPGYGQTTLVCAHVTTHFKGLQHVKIGDIIYYNTTYGAYQYKVTDVLVVKATEADKVYDLRAGYDNLVLYTCYPFYAVAFRSQRFFVCAEKISGPTVNIYE